MLDTARSFAIRWLLEPMKKPKKHVIKMLTAWIDAPNNEDFHIEDTFHVKLHDDNFYDDGTVYLVVDDIIIGKQSPKIIGIKIYIDDEYIGGFCKVQIMPNCTHIYNSSTDEDDYDYEYDISCIYDYESSISPPYNCAQSAEVYGYTQMTEIDPAKRKQYADIGITDPLPEMNYGLGNTDLGGISHVTSCDALTTDYSAMGVFDYRCTNQCELMASTLVSWGTVKAEYKYTCKKTWNIVNTVSKSTGEINIGPIEISEVSTGTREITYGFTDIALKYAPDLASADIQLIYDPKTGRVRDSIGMGDYMHYVDGLTEEKLKELTTKIRDTENYEVITGIDEN